MKRQSEKVLAVFAVSLILVVAARADDLLPPLYRGIPGSTFQTWGFATGVTNPAPDSVNNAFGTPTLTLFQSANNSGIGWQDSLPAVYGSKQGFWDLGDDGHMTLSIPTSSNATAAEQVRVQVTYWQSIDVAPTVLISGVGSGTVVSNILVETGPHNLGSWYDEVIDWTFSPGETNTVISILGNPTQGSVVDQVIVDTIPEPSAVAVGILGLMGVIPAIVRQRRRSRRS